MQSLKQQMEELSVLEKQSYQAYQQPQPTYENSFSQSVRQEVDRYMGELNKSAQQPNQTMASIITAIESNASKEDLDYLVNNVSVIPEYFKSKEGSKTVQQVINGIKKMNTTKEKQDTVEE
ncbi:hypothetical protein [Rahnella laticis]|uniref:hypothetical protein n=1 Tax=Rahnella laticis TaxID=2787622 RepID=UPI0018A2DD3B|nr:hypothetical protein [Rahnella laticis]MBF7995441.1 hypothetical protein [Rahnella laticis]